MTGNQINGSRDENGYDTTNRFWKLIRSFFFFGVRMLSHFNHAQFFVTPWTPCQPPLSMGFSRQEC